MRKHTRTHAQSNTYAYAHVLTWSHTLSWCFIVPLLLRSVQLTLRVRDAQAAYRQQCPADPGVAKTDRNVVQAETGFERRPARPAEPQRDAE